MSGLRAASEGQMRRTASESSAEPEMSSEVQKEKSLALFICIETEEMLELENGIFCHLFILMPDSLHYLKMFLHSQISKMLQLGSSVFDIIDVKPGALPRSNMHNCK